MSRQGPDITVIAGEAPESDEENSQPQNQESSSLEPIAAGVVVSGEASESDEEDSDTGKIPQKDTPASIPPLRVERETIIVKAPGGVEPKTPVKPKYNTLLHRKLREKNASLRNNLVDFVNQSYITSAKEIRTISQHLSKSQTSIQEVSQHMRLVTNDLFNLEDKMDIIATCNILPTINIEPLTPGSSPNSAHGSPIR